MDQFMEAGDELKQQLAATQRQLAEVEAQRQVIGYEIHDGLMQDLTAAVLFLEAAKRDATFSGRGLESFDRSLKLVREAAAEARHLIEHLGDARSLDDGLLPAIRRLIERMQSDYEIQIDFRDLRVEPIEEPSLSAAARWAALRIVGEGLANVARHSQSQLATVSLQQSDAQLVIEVRDQGIGFDPSQIKTGRFGLEGIRHRAKLLGGEAHIASGAGQGTTILVALPLAPSERAK
jgi:signal transduction histidine kinase